MRKACAQQLKYVFVVPALDLPLSDRIHISPAGNMVLGERLAQTALGGVYGRATPSSHPRSTPQSTRRTRRLNCNLIM